MIEDAVDMWIRVATGRFFFLKGLSGKLCLFLLGILLNKSAHKLELYVYLKCFC